MENNAKRLETIVRVVQTQKINTLIKTAITELDFGISGRENTEILLYFSTFCNVDHKSVFELLLSSVLGTANSHSIPRPQIRKFAIGLR